MSVLVKGMQMPRKCSECDFCGGLIWPAMVYACDCPVGPINGINITRAIEEDCRHPNCPFVEVPTPHGRLIDGDKEKAEIDNMIVQGEVFTTAKNFASKVLEKAPTVIEAEE